MTGAAGGLSGGLWAAHGAVLEAGAPWILDALGFDERMRAARAVVTGEGKLDEQTLRASSWARSARVRARPACRCTRSSARDALDGFGKRIIDLQLVQEANGPRADRGRRRDARPRPGRRQL